MNASKYITELQKKTIMLSYKFLPNRPQGCFSVQVVLAGCLFICAPQMSSCSKINNYKI